MDGVKKKLKILLRPGESERRPELHWPKDIKKEPVQVVREVAESLTNLREILLANYANGPCLFFRCRFVVFLPENTAVVPFVEHLH